MPPAPCPPPPADLCHKVTVESDVMPDLWTTTGPKRRIEDEFFMKSFVVDSNISSIFHDKQSAAETKHLTETFMFVTD